jgi:5'-methylthioadenosine phosphorylase
MSTQTKPTLGVIGGTGIYDLEGFVPLTEKELDTPFGKPSDRFVIGRVGSSTVAFLARHGQGHRHIPHEINYRANIYGMKMLGVERLVSITAVGSMKEEIEPGDLVVVDQFFDRTRRRPSSFFGDGLAVHVALADPVCAELAGLAYQAAEKSAPRVHRGGTYLCIEGPQFSTRAESKIYRQWGVEVIGMTNLPEARLAREAEMCFATVALATDYDCWREGEQEVTVESVLEVSRKNSIKAKETVRALADLVADHPSRECECSSALKGAVMTDPTVIPVETLERVKLLVEKYIQ